MQIISEYFAYFSLISIIVMLVVGVAFLFGGQSGIIPDLEWITSADIPLLLIKIIPAIMVITAMHFLLFEASKSIVSGVLQQFSTALSLGYISGCLYPIYFFPETVQKFSTFLPSGIARAHIANCLCNDFNPKTLPGLGIYFVVFLTAAFIIRRFKIKGRE